MSAFDDEQDALDTMPDIIWDPEDLAIIHAAAAKLQQVKPLALAPVTDDALGDDFWDNPTFLPGENQPDLMDLVPYADALFAMFPQGLLFTGLAKNKTPLACTIIGSSVVSFRGGEGRWIRSIGTVPIPDIDWREPHRGRKLPATAVMAARKCKTPQEFRMWLNWVASKIMEGGGKYLTGAVHQDNFVPDLRFALQVAYDLQMIGASFEMVYSEVPTLHWTTHDIKPWTYNATILRGGKPIGSIKLRHANGAWRYGAMINQRVMAGEFKGTEPMQYKHQAPGHVGIDPQGVEVAKGLAAKLFASKTFEWLATTAGNSPVLRGC